MNRRQFQQTAEQARRRAVALGEAGDPQAIGELLGLCRHPGPTVRRAAASALGKLAGNPGLQPAVPVLCELTHDPHPQVRQYALVALARIGDEAALPACRDAVHRPGEPDYVLGAALRAVEQIEATAKARQAFGSVACSRCGKPATAEERDLAERQFQRVYCGACFNAVFIERRNFDMKVQNQKTILTADRTVVQSKGERQIADWLHTHGIEYRYDDKFQIIQGFAVRPDFYLPRFDLYIEYWAWTPPTTRSACCTNRNSTSNKANACSPSTRPTSRTSMPNSPPPSGRTCQTTRPAARVESQAPYLSH